MGQILGKIYSVIIFLLIAQTALFSVPNVASGQEQTITQPTQSIDLAKWGIYKDGTHPIETTKGINEALIWANQNGITEVSLPPGTYLIDKNSRINMVSNMLFRLPMEAVLQKETNGKERYDVMYLGYGVNNVTLIGGTYIGDKLTHDYTQKDTKYSSGTHEAGHGITMEGAKNVTVEGVKSINFTGDGLVLGGYGRIIRDVYENSFIQGGIDATGKMVKSTTKIRTKVPLDFKNTLVAAEKRFEISNILNLPTTFEVYFYKADGKFIKKIYAKMRDQIAVPTGADYYHLVFNQPTAVKAYLEYWTRVQTQNVIVKNSEFASNRRQGITVGGADNVQIIGNSIHDMKGTAPQSGIDVEGGFQVNGFFNSNVTIKNNDLYNNFSYDVILFDGKGALVEDNKLRSTGAIGVAVSKPFQDARVINNTFEGARIVAVNNAVFEGNKMSDSSAQFEGPNITVNGMELTDSVFSVNAQTPYGVVVSNVTMYNNRKRNSGFNVVGKPIRITNLTLIGQSGLRVLTGNGPGGSVFDNLKILGYNADFGVSLPAGTYNNARFEAAEDGGTGIISASQPGDYSFYGCNFISNSAGGGTLFAENKVMNIIIQKSNFKMLGNKSSISIQAAQSLLIESNNIESMQLTSKGIDIIKINDYGKRNEVFDILSAMIRYNKITSNIQASGISTLYAGVDAPPFTIANNLLYGARLTLKENDISINNLVYN